MTKEYLTKEVAARRSGRSVRRLLELAAAGRIRKTLTTDPKKGNRAIALFDARDIDQLARGAAPPPMSLQISSPVRNVAAVSHMAPASLLESPNPWLTLDEAANYVRLPTSFLSGLIEEGKLKALDVGVRPGGRFRVCRRDLDSIAGTKLR